jgi:hypothetical protein
MSDLTLKASNFASTPVDDAHPVPVKLAIPACTLYEATLVASGAVSAVAAPASGNHLEIYRLECQAGADGDQTVAWREAAGGTDKYKALLTTKGDIISRQLGGSWHLPTATALFVNPSASTSVRVLVEYRTVAD